MCERKIIFPEVNIMSAERESNLIVICNNRPSKTPGDYKILIAVIFILYNELSPIF